MHNTAPRHPVSPCSVLLRLALIVFVAMLGGCDWGHTVEADSRAGFVLDGGKPFVIELGRGSGLNGLDIVKVDETGAVLLSRYERRPVPESATLTLSAADVAVIVASVNTKQITSLGRSYSDPHMHDGTQWVLWIEQGQSQKAIYFNNSMPEEIIAFAHELDALLHKAGQSRVTWHEIPSPQAIGRQDALWARTE